MNKMEQAIHAAGFVRDPNTCFCDRNVSCWYPAGKSHPDAPGHYIEVHPDRIRVFKLKWFGNHGTRACFWDKRTVAVFEDVNGLCEWLDRNGEYLDALPPFANSWD